VREENDESSYWPNQVQVERCRSIQSEGPIRCAEHGQKHVGKRLPTIFIVGRAMATRRSADFRFAVFYVAL
jgi:hypothetical protein